MPITIEQATVPVFIRGLKVLSTLLQKGADHARSQGLDAATLVDARLAPDMFSLAGQVQRASDTAKLGVQRLSAVEAPRYADDETTLEQLQARIAKTIAWLESVPSDALAAAESRTVTLGFKDFKPTFTAISYVLTFALPNFYFHVTTAYDILRNQGVPVGKLDYLGPYQAAN
ncbi:hypothetical protein CEG14_03995 [Bordetella genomosp. 1]|uniref:DUF1993 domain-containing protein n=1 Tax=Bordetella genomosp. 1 TaxID=1395607 RepID=A0A261SVA2_9BORD|nr:DUF1993 domain-containing protein [Bordetella genomosp. 1]MDQ8031057.1 DUF1993 domain-containing protein [Bordetella sp.]OZI40922.1 hypothetical protein CEG14_03995 [Bordetella genomosp. 1]OZI69114.1 hypothetical protein CAL27_06625 [Bordetella genomosp. 1]